MKQVMQYYARCNAKINEDMIRIIAGNIKDPLNLKLSGYFFTTLGKLLEHVYISDMNWLKAFMNLDDYGINLEKEMGPIPGYEEDVFKDFDQYRNSRNKLDGLIIQYIDKMESEYFTKKVERVNRKGEKTEKLCWKALVHFFNHQTHHRGQISCILDEMNIENNYSNMISIE